MKKGDQDSEHGSAYFSALAYQKQLVKQAELLMRFEKMWSDYEEQGIVITAIRVLFGGVGSDEVRIVVKCRREGGSFVAFHSGSTLVEALVGTLNRLENETLKWKDDQYA